MIWRRLALGCVDFYPRGSRSHGLLATRGLTPAATTVCVHNLIPKRCATSLSLLYQSSPVEVHPHPEAGSPPHSLQTVAANIPVGLRRNHTLFYQNKLVNTNVREASCDSLPDVAAFPHGQDAAILDQEARPQRAERQPASATSICSGIHNTRASESLQEVQEGL